MASDGTVTVDVKTSEAFNGLVDIVEAIEDILALVPEWHHIEARQIMQRIEGEISRLIVSR